MNTRQLFPVLLVSLLSIATVSAQLTNPVGYTVPAPDYNFKFDPAPDPAMRHNRLLQDRTDDGVFTQVGAYKVKGSPNLFGGRIEGNMFGGTTKAYNIYLNYNTYNQELGFYSTSNPVSALYKEPGEVDSFFLLANKDAGIDAPLKFIYGSHIGSKEKSFYQEVYKGKQYSVYKKYKSELAYVSENYIQPDLRRFDLVAEYFYTGPDKKLKKIKQGTANVVKEFKDVKDLKNVVADDAFSMNTDGAFKRMFEYLDK
jgi:hypothetical protein